MPAAYKFHTLDTCQKILAQKLKTPHNGAVSISIPLAEEILDRLKELTARRAKGAIPFRGKHLCL